MCSASGLPVRKSCQSERAASQRELELCKLHALPEVHDMFS
jgi:hypothetical protein